MTGVHSQTRLFILDTRKALMIEEERGKLLERIEGAGLISPLDLPEHRSARRIEWVHEVV
jgi:hypothetical protein